MTDHSPADLVLDALGNQIRRDILGMLRDSPLTVGAIAGQLPISRPAVSKHLRILHEAGLVAYNPDGTRNVFYLRPTGFAEARGFLNRFWDEALDSFQRYATEINDHP